VDERNRRSRSSKKDLEKRAIAYGGGRTRFGVRGSSSRGLENDPEEKITKERAKGGKSGDSWEIQMVGEKNGGSYSTLGKPGTPRATQPGRT